MQYREYGKTGVQVSVLGFGAMRLPKKQELAVEILRRAFDLGVNYVDTAASYPTSNHGANERLVGEALKGYRNRVFVSTKNHYKGASVDEWQVYLDRSLKNLGVDTIDFYHLHALRWDVYRQKLVPGGIMERFKRAKEDGVIRHACFSSHDRPENIVKLVDTSEFDGMLVQYNLLDRANEGAIAHAHAQGMGVAIMGPVGGGKLIAPSERILSMVGEAQSTPEVALRFVLSNPNVTLALSGMKTLEMVEENVATAGQEESLSGEERQRFVEALEEVQQLSDLYCTGCGYCLPCPSKVDIPGNFEAMNYYRVWGLEKLARKRYKQLGRNKSRRWAAACVECGACESKCPQNIPIRERLKEVAATLGS
jgi:predicted aldo/keto reductase-like oxidoreductase